MPHNLDYEVCCFVTLRVRMSKEVVEQVFGWLTLFGDATIKRRWSVENQTMAFTMHVSPSNDTIMDRVATRDMTINDETKGLVCIFLPQTTLQ